jgi:hypothetical protein
LEILEERTSPSTAAVSKGLAGLPLNAGVLRYAQGQVGTFRTIGSGECTDLAIAALDAVHAQGNGDFGVPVTATSHYLWGVPVFQKSLEAGYRNAGSYKNVRPGDVAQFDDFRTASRVHGWTDAPHHTAVVESIDAHGRLGVVQQNWNDHQYAERGVFWLNEMTSGVVTIYQPTP